MTGTVTTAVKPIAAPHGTTPQPSPTHLSISTPWDAEFISLEQIPHRTMSRITENQEGQGTQSQ